MYICRCRTVVAGPPGLSLPPLGRAHYQSGSVRGCAADPGLCSWPGGCPSGLPAGSSPAAQGISPGQAFPCWPDRLSAAIKLSERFCNLPAATNYTNTCAGTTVTRRISRQTDTQRYFRVVRDHSGGSEINVALRDKYAAVRQGIKKDQEHSFLAPLVSEDPVKADRVQ